MTSRKHAIILSLISCLFLTNCAVPTKKERVPDEQRSPAAMEARSEKLDLLTESLKEASQLGSDSIKRLDSMSDAFMDIGAGGYGASTMTKDIILQSRSLVAKDGTSVRPRDIAEAVVNSQNAIDEFATKNTDYLYDEDVAEKVDLIETANKKIAQSLGIIAGKVEDPSSAYGSALVQFLSLAPKVVSNQLSAVEIEKYIKILDQMNLLLRFGQKVETSEQAWALAQDDDSAETKLEPWMKEQFGTRIKDAHAEGYEIINDEDSPERIKKIKISIRKKSKKREGKYNQLSPAIGEELKNPLILVLKSSQGYELSGMGKEMALPSVIDMSQTDQVLERRFGQYGHARPFHTVTTLHVGKDTITYAENTYRYGGPLFGRLRNATNGEPSSFFQVEMAYTRHAGSLEITALRITEKRRSKLKDTTVTKLAVEVLLETTFSLGAK